MDKKQSRFFIATLPTNVTEVGVPPAELLFNRTVQGQLSVLNKKNNLNRHKEAQNNERKRKEYNEKYEARKHKSKKSELNVGDRVLVRQERKLTSTFKPIPYVVTKHEHSRVTARNQNGHVVTRNVSYFKRIPKLMNTDTDIDDEINIGRPDNVIERGNATNNATQAEVPNELVRRSRRIRGKPDRFGRSVS